MQPVSLAFNAAVISIANKLFPCGFDVSGVDTTERAPSTYRGLCERLNAGQRMVVSGENSGDTIYADPEVNYAFRAWHDWCHWRGQHEFTLAGEFNVYLMQCDHLLRLYGASEQTAQWCELLYAEIVAQAEHYHTTGEFPADQRAFVEAFICPQGTAQL